MKELESARIAARITAEEQALGAMEKKSASALRDAAKAKAGGRAETGAASALATARAEEDIQRATLEELRKLHAEAKAKEERAEIEAKVDAALAEAEKGRIALVDAMEKLGPALAEVAGIIASAMEAGAPGGNALQEIDPRQEIISYLREHVRPMDYLENYVRTTKAVLERNAFILTEMKAFKWASYREELIESWPVRFERIEKDRAADAERAAKIDRIRAEHDRVSQAGGVIQAGR